MKLHYGGKFRTEEDFKSRGEHHEGAVAFREPSQKVFAIAANAGSIVLLILLLFVIYLLAGKGFREYGPKIWIGAVISLITLIPHEILHAVCSEHSERHAQGKSVFQSYRRRLCNVQ